MRMSIVGCVFTLLGIWAGSVLWFVWRNYQDAKEVDEEPRRYEMPVVTVSEAELDGNRNGRGGEKITVGRE